MARPPSFQRWFALGVAALFLLLTALAVSPVTDAGHAAGGRPIVPTEGVWFEEVVTDPQTDWDKSGSVTTSDEYVTFWNAGSATIDLGGWTLAMDDSTPESQALDGALPGGGRRLVLNPTGQMNNDVALRLTDASGALVDVVTLGAGAIPDGNADNALNEAVVLAGAWAGHRAPAFAGTGVAALWVESIARSGTPPGAPFGTAWVAADAVQLEVRAHLAPGTPAPTALRLPNGTEVPLSNVSTGLWRSQVFALPDAPFAPLAVVAGGVLVERYPGRDALTLQVDASPPRFGATGDTVVVNATGHLRWIPPAIDAESGVAAWSVAAMNGTNITEITGCAPADDPGASCSLSHPNATVRLSAMNGAGARTQLDLVPALDLAPPNAPSSIESSSGSPPLLAWAPFDEPLKRLVLQVADDATGVWLREERALAPDATQSEAIAWVPGEPRAYRVVGTDRGDNEVASPWTALTGNATDVRATLIEIDARTQQLALAGTVEIVATFDRAMATAPALELVVQEPRPLLLVFEGLLGADGRTVSFAAAGHAALPRAGSGVWRLSGGQGADGAAIADTDTRVEWDAEPPTVRAEGATSHWVRAKRHVVTVSAQETDAGKAKIVLDPLPKGVRASGPSAAKRVTFAAEGVHTVQGRAEDAAGNARPFTLRIALDATPPTVLVDKTAEVWGHDEPLILSVTDRGSGVNQTSLRVWVRNATAATDAVKATWNGSLVALRPAEIALTGPYEIHAAVADVAGNAAEGLVGRRLPAATAARPSAPERAELGAPAEPSGASAPRPVGPAWGVSTVPAPISEEEARPASSLWDPSEWEPLPSTTAAASVEGDDGGWLGAGLMGIGGAVGLGTAVRHVRRRRLRAKPTASVDDLTDRRTSSLRQEPERT